MSEEELKAIKILENINIDKAGRTTCNLLDGYKCTLGKRCYENEVNCQKEAIKVVLNLITKQQKEIKDIKKDYHSLKDRIELSIDKFDYAFEKAKRRNDKDKSDYYWDLIRNFKKLLEE